MRNKLLDNISGILLLLGCFLFIVSPPLAAVGILETGNKTLAYTFAYLILLSAPMLMAQFIMPNKEVTPIKYILLGIVMDAILAYTDFRTIGNDSDILHRYLFYGLWISIIFVISIKQFEREKGGDKHSIDSRE